MVTVPSAADSSSAYSSVSYSLAVATGVVPASLRRSPMINGPLFPRMFIRGVSDALSDAMPRAPAVAMSADSSLSPSHPCRISWPYFSRKERVPVSPSPSTMSAEYAVMTYVSPSAPCDTDGRSRYPVKMRTPRHVASMSRSAESTLRYVSPVRSVTVHPNSAHSPATRLRYAPETSGVASTASPKSSCTVTRSIRPPPAPGPFS